MKQIIKNLYGNANGFSLVELIIVMVVAGIVIAASGLMINQANQGSKQGKALHRLLADIRFAQETAVAQNTSVNFTVSGNNYNATYTATPSVYLISPISGGNLNVQMNSGDYSGVSITSTNLGGGLTFNRIGEPLMGGANIQITVTVATLTGGRSVMINPAGYTFIQ